MTYTREDLINDVTKEAIALRREATKDELGRLSAENHDPLSTSACLYGQMCLSCHSHRAKQLVKECAPALYTSHGATAKRIENDSDRNREIFYSPIDVYTILPDANNANLIGYLKGYTETLEL